nr:MAG TPA: NADH-ubiquinone oxidoreductase [Caudoviricetes sp.]
MTNQEYEASSIAAAGCYDRFEGEHKLKKIDEHIAQVEKTLVTLNEMRREIVNQYNLNRCAHDFDYNPRDMCGQCVKCGVQKR